MNSLFQFNGLLTADFLFPLSCSCSIIVLLNKTETEKHGKTLVLPMRAYAHQVSLNLFLDEWMLGLSRCFWEQGRLSLRTWWFAGEEALILTTHGKWRIKRMQIDIWFIIKHTNKNKIAKTFEMHTYCTHNECPPQQCVSLLSDVLDR
jgi:hypothetical protein